MFQINESFRKLMSAAITKQCSLIQGFVPDSTTYTATSKKSIAFLCIYVINMW